MSGEVETASLRLLTATPWGGPLAFLCVALAVAAVALGGRALAKAATRRLRWLQRLPGWAWIVAAVLASAALIASAVRGLSRYAGEVTAVVVVGEGAQRRVEASFFSRGKHGGGSSTAWVFAVDGRALGVRRPGWGCGARAHWDGVGQAAGYVVERQGDHLTLLDGVTLDEALDLTRALDQRLGKGQYQVREVSGEAITALRKDGVEEVIALAGLVPQARREEPRLWVTSSDACSSSQADFMEAARAWSRSTGLLRPQALVAPSTSSDARPCAYTLRGQQAALVLHRAEAFGDDSAHLLSAVPLGDPARPLWTVDIGLALGRIGRGLPYTLHAPAVRADGTLCLWLLRARQSLSEVCVGADGALLSAQVVF